MGRMVLALDTHVLQARATRTTVLPLLVLHAQQEHTPQQALAVHAPTIDALQEHLMKMRLLPPPAPRAPLAHMHPSAALSHALAWFALLEQPTTTTMLPPTALRVG